MGTRNNHLLWCVTANEQILILATVQVSAGPPLVRHVVRATEIEHGKLHGFLEDLMIIVGVMCCFYLY